MGISLLDKTGTFEASELREQNSFGSSVRYLWERTWGPRQGRYLLNLWSHRPPWRQLGNALQAAALGQPYSYSTCSSTELLTDGVTAAHETFMGFLWSTVPLNHIHPHLHARLFYNPGSLKGINKDKGTSSYVSIISIFHTGNIAIIRSTQH